MTNVCFFSKMEKRKAVEHIDHVLEKQRDKIENKITENEGHASKMNELKQKVTDYDALKKFESREKIFTTELKN